jgi:hypothetical protein
LQQSYGFAPALTRAKFVDLEGVGLRRSDIQPAPQVAVLYEVKAGAP